MGVRHDRAGELKRGQRPRRYRDRCPSEGEGNSDVPEDRNTASHSAPGQRAATSASQPYRRESRARSASSLPCQFRIVRAHSRTSAGLRLNVELRMATSPGLSLSLAGHCLGIAANPSARDVGGVSAAESCLHPECPPHPRSRRSRSVNVWYQFGLQLGHVPGQREQRPRVHRGLPAGPMSHVARMTMLVLLDGSPSMAVPASALTAVAHAVDAPPRGGRWTDRCRRGRLLVVCQGAASAPWLPRTGGCAGPRACVSPVCTRRRLVRPWRSPACPRRAGRDRGASAPAAAVRDTSG
jgi:hypothetical protein